MYEKYQSKLTVLEQQLTLYPHRLAKGISVVIPIYDGIDYIDTSLKSLMDQNINNANYEIILVFNGKFHDEVNYIYSNENFNKNLDITILINDEPSAGAARNLGVKYAKYSHITFVDIDDFLSENFIQSNFNHLEDNTILFSQIHNIENEQIDTENVLNLEILNSYEKRTISLIDLNRISTITACKVIPKNLLLTQNFRSYLRSGEDTVYFCELFTNNRPKLKVIPLEENAIYYRLIRENSVSRKASSHDFLISQRIEILEILDQLLQIVKNKQVEKLITFKYNAQITFMNKYLKENLNEHQEIVNMIKSMNFEYFNFSLLNKGIASRLIVSYCFPPFSDTSATIIAKRILEDNEIVDVVSNNLNKIRNKESSLKNLIEHLVGNHALINTQASFSNMYYLSEFINNAFAKFLVNENSYKEVYSRAMFPISHFPPLFMKFIKPNIKWTAEFSDPLLIDINSNERYANIENDSLVKNLSEGLLGNFSKYVDENLFNLMEIIPFHLADELVFTNENQLEFMISRFTEEEREYIREKSVILKHPTLGREHYQIKNTDNNFDPAIINIGYFGNFYNNRSYNQFIDLITYLNHNFKYLFKLHIYTNKQDMSNQEIEELNKNKINVNDYLPFLDFLNTTTKLDMLLINDTKTKQTKSVNPYLPSKLSDYIGSGIPILSLTENGSIMSKMNLSNMIKINQKLFEESTINLSASTMKQLIANIESIVSKKEERLVTVERDSIIFSNSELNMSLTNDLVLENIEKQEWMIKPKQLPIKMKNDYIITIQNITEKKISFKVQSFYSMKNVIKVDFIYENQQKNRKCISTMRRSESIELNPGQKIKFKLNYKKYYDQYSFLEAGRLKFTGI